MNKVILIGRLTADPELRQTQSGISACSFTVAINNGKDKDGNERDPDFINCKAWRQTADFIGKWWSKGKMIALEGKFKTDKYQDKKYPDVNHYSSYVLVDNAEFCGDKSGTSGTGASTSYSAPQATRQTPPAPTPAELGDLGDFEEILSDGEVPF